MPPAQQMAQVAQPITPGGCWATSAGVRVRGGVVRARMCSLPARRGRLTCVVHKGLNAAAKELRRSLKGRAAP